MIGLVAGSTAALLVGWLVGGIGYFALKGRRFFKARR